MPTCATIAMVWTVDQKLGNDFLLPIYALVTSRRVGKNIASGVLGPLTSLLSKVLFRCLDYEAD